MTTRSSVLALRILRREGVPWGRLLGWARGLRPLARLAGPGCDTPIAKSAITPWGSDPVWKAWSNWQSTWLCRNYDLSGKAMQQLNINTPLPSLPPSAFRPLRCLSASSVQVLNRARSWETTIIVTSITVSTPGPAQQFACLLLHQRHRLEALLGVALSIVRGVPPATETNSPANSKPPSGASPLLIRRPVSLAHLLPINLGRAPCAWSALLHRPLALLVYVQVA